MWGMKDDLDHRFNMLLDLLRKRYGLQIEYNSQEDALIDYPIVEIDSKDDLANEYDAMEVRLVCPSQAIIAIIGNDQDEPIADPSKEILPIDNLVFRQHLTVVIVH